MPGAITAALVARIRERAGEYSTNGYSDANIYDQIRRGQLEIGWRLVEAALFELSAQDTGSLAASLIDVPEDFWRLQRLLIGGKAAKPLPVADLALWDGYASDADPYYYFTADASTGAPQIMVLCDTATAAYALDYLKIPTNVDATTDPALGLPLHDLLVDFALAELLKTRQRWDEARAVEQDLEARLARINARFGGAVPKAGPPGDA